MLGLFRDCFLSLSSSLFSRRLRLCRSRFMRPLVVFLTLVVGWCGVRSDAADVGATASDRSDLKGFFPLEVGNSWTYRHHYGNYMYSWWEDWEPEYGVYPEWVVSMRQYELPMYPMGGARPPGRLLSTGIDEDDPTFMVEITHTEWIGGHEYFVFSDAPYDWPPMPSLFWAGHKVRWNDDDVLLVRWNDTDMPLYDFDLLHPTADSTSVFLYNPDLGHSLSDFGYSPYIRVERRISESGDVALLRFRHALLCEVACSWRIFFVYGYGMGLFEREQIGYGDNPIFYNYLFPISAVLSGEEVSYEEGTKRAPGLVDPTAVGVRSWGFVKNEFAPKP